MKLRIVNGKLCPKWDWGILFPKRVHHAMHTLKNRGSAHRRYTDVIQIVKNRPLKRLIHLANTGASA